MIQTQSISGYSDKLVSLVKLEEEYRPFIYLDSIRVPTIGYGYALLARGVDDFSNISDSQEFTRHWGSIWVPSSNATNFLNSVVAIFNDQFLSPSARNQAADALYAQYLSGECTPFSVDEPSAATVIIYGRSVGIFPWCCWRGWCAKRGVY